MANDLHCQVVSDKFADKLPLNKQSARFRRKGVYLHSSTLFSNVIAFAILAGRRRPRLPSGQPGPGLRWTNAVFEAQPGGLPGSWASLEQLPRSAVMAALTGKRRGGRGGAEMLGDALRVLSTAGLSIDVPAALHEAEQPSGVQRGRMQRLFLVEPLRPTLDGRDDGRGR